MEFPLVVRMPYGGGVRAPELHDDSPEAYYVHTPGVKVAIPSTPADAKGLLAAAIRDPDPVVILEPKLIYRAEKQDVPDGEHVVPLGQARLAREGTDVTLVAYGAMVPVCERAADALAGEASVEVLDLRSLRPLDEDALLASAAKTGRVVIVQEAPRIAGFGAELAAILAEKAILDLRGPVLRVTGFDVPYPYWKIEDALHAVGRARHGRRAKAARVLNASRGAPSTAFSRDYEPVAVGRPRRAGHVPVAQRGLVVGRRRRAGAAGGTRGHALNGPIEVRGATRRADARRPHRRGRPARRGAGRGRSTRPFTWGLERRHLAAGPARASRRLPFLGVIGMPPPEPGEHSTTPPRRWGGNIDCKELVAGTTLYLPIPVDGAWLMAGDGHGAQGDGEVSGTAIECPLERATLTLDVDRPRAPLPDRAHRRRLARVRLRPRSRRRRRPGDRDDARPDGGRARRSRGPRRARSRASPSTST